MTLHFMHLTRKYYNKTNLVIHDPVKRPTPYGGQLEWKLPAGNKLIAHLKDKTKIRHKKRWSQVREFVQLDNVDFLSKWLYSNITSYLLSDRVYL